MSRSLAVVLILAALAAPLAAAGWGVKGAYEPDQRRDISDGWMYASPETSSDQTIRQVYFSGFQGHTANSLNPNLATVRSGHSGQDFVIYAVLGVWKDCNRDGFMGMGDQGLFEYRSTILLDATVCPSERTPSATQGDPHYTILCGNVRCPPKDWFPSHNDGQWVREFLQLGWYDAWTVVGDHNMYNINANDTRVWYDWGLPESVFTGGGCWINPPRGSLQSTGGMLYWADCLTGYRGTDTLNAVLPDNMDFSDHPRQQHNSRSPLNQPHPWGRQEDPSAVEMWDCSAKPTPVLTISSGRYVNISKPRVPPTVSSGQPRLQPITPANNGWTLSGTANSTGSGFDECHRNTYQNSYDHTGGSIDPTSAPGDHWHPGTYLAQFPYRQERAVVNSAVKIGASGTLHPDDQNRPAPPYATLLGQGTPDDLGRRTTGDEFMWLDQVQYVNGGPGVDQSSGITPVTNMTFYAYVGAGTIAKYNLRLPKGSTTGTYGQEVCGSSIGQTIVKSGWQCNGALWYIDALGNDISPHARYLGRDQTAPASERCDPPSAGIGGTPRYATAVSSRACIDIAARPGSFYNLRDIDCYDHSVHGARQLGAHWGILTGTKCDPAP